MGTETRINKTLLHPHLIKVKLNDPLMGTETISHSLGYSWGGNVFVKLNNPLMGTEIKVGSWCCLGFLPAVKLNNPLMGTETSHNVHINYTLLNTLVKLNNPPLDGNHNLYGEQLYKLHRSVKKIIPWWGRELKQHLFFKFSKNFYVKLNNPLMGTETFVYPATLCRLPWPDVKLNNPLMGTETRSNILVDRLLQCLRVKFINPHQGSETSFNILYPLLIHILRVKCNDPHKGTETPKSLCINRSEY